MDLCTIFLLIIRLLILVIFSIHKYLIKKHDFKQCLKLFEETIGLLTSIVNASNNTKCFSLSNQKCMTQPALINLYLNEYSQEFFY